jgi:hypothetical protein
VVRQQLQWRGIDQPHRATNWLTIEMGPDDLSMVVGRR